MPNAQIPVQQTGFMQTQHTAFSTISTESLRSPPRHSSNSGHRPFSKPFYHKQQVLQQNQPQPPSFLQPQATGANPFRQSVCLYPKQLAWHCIGGAGMGGQGHSTFSTHKQCIRGLIHPHLSLPLGIAFSAASSIASPFAQSPSSGPTASSTLPASSLIYTADLLRLDTQFSLTSPVQL